MTAPLQEVHGSCHCGAVRFSAQLSLAQTATCNCSICSRSGAIMAFVPQAQFQQTQGQDALNDYQFGKRHIHHVFCKHCGMRPFAFGASPDGASTYMINLRCVDDLDLSQLTPAEYDGKSL